MKWQFVGLFAAWCFLAYQQGRIFEANQQAASLVKINDRIAEFQFVVDAEQREVAELKENASKLMATIQLLMVMRRMDDRERAIQQQIPPAPPVCEP